MHDRKVLLATCIALSCVIIGCSKPANDAAADAKTASAATDRSADVRMIIALDSGWMRQVMAKNVDSLMTYYAPDAVSYGFGAPGTGTDQIRSLYTEMVKSTISDPKLNSNTVKFSDDGTMAYDHGTYSISIAPPGGKATVQPGGFLNVWRKMNGQWKLVAEMSTPIPPPK